jgi:hypothetical protein
VKGDRIFYSEGCKYQLRQDYTVQTGIRGCPAVTYWLQLSRDGSLTIRKGYAWDGPSGPTIDTPDSMRGSLVHDALYQLMRLGLLSEDYREKADNLLQDICEEDGMPHLRAEIWEEAVKHFAASCAKAGSEPEVLTAPRPPTVPLFNQFEGVMT